MRILIAEDDRRMSALLQRGLVEEGHVVDHAATGRKAMELARAADFDIVVLDVMFPDLNGLAVVKHLREHGNRTPVLMLTARDTNADVVLGLNAGADDYLTKPFSFDVLLARIHALARRGPTVLPQRLQVGKLSLDPVAHAVTSGDTELALTRTEFSLLEYLMRRAGRVVTRRALIEGVWGQSRDVGDNTLDAFVKLLRQKLGNGEGGCRIHTIRGIGYTIRRNDD